MTKKGNDPNIIMTFRDFIPNPLRFWILILITLVFLFSGAVQMASASTQVSLFGFRQEDTMMMGYCAFVGMNLIFPILFPINFRFSSKTILSTVALVLIGCHLITLYTTNVFLLCFINFVAGTFRMIGAFETLVCAQLTITPSRNYAIFYCTIFFIVQGSAIFFGAQVAYVIEWMSWTHLHWLIIALLIGTWSTVYLLFRHYRSMKKIPLYGIDWAGYTLWCISFIAILFVTTYGKYYDWFDSIHIRFASAIAVGTLALNVYHMFRIKRPYISLETWRYKGMGKLILLFLALYVMLATPSSLQNSFMSKILHYDSLHVVYLNWFVLSGMVLSAFLCYFWFFRLKLKIRPMIFLSFACVVAYLISIYYLIDPETDIQKLYFPAFLRGIGLLLLYIVLTIYIANITPFKHNFQAICIVGMIRMSLGTALGSSLIDNWMHHLTAQNTMKLSLELDAVNPNIHLLDLSTLSAKLSQQVMMVSMKEIYGWMALFGVFLLLFIILERDVNMSSISFPKMRNIRHIFKRRE